MHSTLIHRVSACVAGTVGDKLYLVDAGECQEVQKFREEGKKKADRVWQERVVRAV
jgi:hypothetical protein